MRRDIFRIGSPKRQLTCHPERCPERNSTKRTESAKKEQSLKVLEPTRQRWNAI